MERGAGNHRIAAILAAAGRSALILSAFLLPLETALAAEGAGEAQHLAATTLPEPLTMLVAGSLLAGAAWCGRRLPGLGRKEPPDESAE